MEIVEKRFGGKATKWKCYDEEGEVFGRPSMVEADLLVADREHVLVEVKSSVSRGDVYELWRIGRLYEKETEIKPKLVVVSPFVDERAEEVAEKLRVEVYARSGSRLCRSQDLMQTFIARVSPPAPPTGTGH